MEGDAGCDPKRCGSIYSVDGACDCYKISPIIDILGITDASDVETIGAGEGVEPDSEEHSVI